MPEDPLPDSSVPDGWSTDFHVHSWQAGDDSAFLALEAHFKPLLLSRVRFHSAWPYLSRHFEAEDVVQEVWVRVISYAKTNFTSSGKGSFHAMLRKICDRTLGDLIENRCAQKRGGGESGESLGEQHAEHVVVRPGVATPETPTGAARVEEKIEIARRVLSEREFLAWQHIELEGYTSEEVGDLVLDCPSSTVRRLLMQARARLARVF